MSARLYTVVVKLDEHFTDEFEEGYSDQPPADWERWDEWNEFCMSFWGKLKPFFLPKAGGIYKSRSSAVQRANLINYWGGSAEVLECTPRWETLDAAKKRRATARQAERVAVARKRLDVELAKLEAVSS